MLSKIIAVFWLIISSTAFAYADSPPKSAGGRLEGASTAKRTIVGVWRPANGRQCTTFQGAIRIGPMFMGGDEFKCDFTAVSREGDTVRWKGSCSIPEPPKPTTVIARLRGDRLTLQFDHDKEGESFVRCKGDKFEEP
jgi:hypothetical protein